MGFNHSFLVHVSLWCILTNECLHGAMCCVKRLRGHEKLFGLLDWGFEPVVLGGPGVHGVLGTDSELLDDLPCLLQSSVLLVVVFE